MKKSIILLSILILIFLSLFLSGCAKSVSEVLKNKEEYLGKQITVSGIVENSIKIFSFSGYTLKDEKTEETIFIKTDNLKTEGKKVNIKGTLMKELGMYYILEK